MKRVLRTTLIGMCIACAFTMAIGIIVMMALSATEQIISPWHLLWFVPVSGGVTGSLVGFIVRLIDDCE